MKCTTYPDSGPNHGAPETRVFPKFRVREAVDADCGFPAEDEQGDRAAEVEQHEQHVGGVAAGCDGVPVFFGFRH